MALPLTLVAKYLRRRAPTQFKSNNQKVINNKGNKAIVLEGREVGKSFVEEAAKHS